MFCAATYHRHPLSERYRMFLTLIEGYRSVSYEWLLSKFPSIVVTHFVCFCSLGFLPCTHSWWLDRICTTWQSTLFSLSLSLSLLSSLPLSSLFLFPSLFSSSLSLLPPLSLSSLSLLPSLSLPSLSLFQSLLLFCLSLFLFLYHSLPLHDPTLDYNIYQRNVRSQN